MEKKDADAKTKCRRHFERIYGESSAKECLNRLDDLLAKYQLKENKTGTNKEQWTHEDQILITYADMIKSDIDEKSTHLGKLNQFFNEHLAGLISTVHLLPFYPSSSDDGFSVIDYKAVDEQIGNWQDIEQLGRDFHLMADLVINHTSRYSHWFRMFLKRKVPYDDYYIEVSKDADLSAVTRPRSTPLVVPVQTRSGETLVWTTFSDDQMDVNFSNVNVLFEFLDIFFFYIKEGIRVIRLDAVAFLWKELGTSCIHLPETHEIVKLFRTLVDHYMPEVTLITETNVPHKENISYFGDGDEAHMVYQFSLPPLLLHAILTENSSYLTEWASSLNTLPENCTYFNFTASHDGIGVRPLEGLVPDEEFYGLVKGVEMRGGHVSYKQNPDKTHSPYELNITYYDAFKNFEGEKDFQKERYFCSQILMMSMIGVPGIYFHNLTGTPNFHEGVRLTGRYRTINRKKWRYNELIGELEDQDSQTAEIFNIYCDLIEKRNQHPAFHPMGDQKVFDMGKKFFCMLRTHPEDEEQILVLANVTGEPVETELQGKKPELPIEKNQTYRDVLYEETEIRGAKVTLNPYQVIWVEIEE